MDEAELSDSDSDDEMATRSEEHTSELQSHSELVCRLLLEKKKKKMRHSANTPNANYLFLNHFIYYNKT